MTFVKRTSLRRTISFILTAVIMLSALSCTIAANADTAAADGTQNGGIVLAKYFSDGVSFAQADSWIPAEGCTSSIIKNTNGRSLRLLGKSGTTAASVTFEEGADPSEYKEIGVYVRSLATGACSVSFSVKYENGESALSVQIPASEEYYVFLPVMSGKGNVTEISFAASYNKRTIDNSTAAISVFLREAVFSKTDHTDNVQKYSAFDLTGLEDTKAKEGTPVTAVPAIIPSGERYALLLRIRGKGGSFAFKIAEGDEPLSVYGSDVISPDREAYIIQIDASFVNPSYSIEFSGIGEDGVELCEVRVIPIKTHETESPLGGISKCTTADGTVTVTGSVTRDTAVKYIDGRLNLYEIPVWQDEDSALAGEAVMSIEMSTSFSFSLPVSDDFSNLAAYVVAIQDKSGVYPISSPIFPSKGNATEADSDFSSVMGISPEDGFLAGYDSYVIDVSIDRLFLEKISTDTTVFTFDGYPYYPSREFVSDISLKVQFLSAAGMDVIFRMDNGEADILGNAKDCRRYSAAVSYLADTFSPAGFITDTAYAKDSSTAEMALASAHAIRLTSSVTDNKALVYTVFDSGNDIEAYFFILAKYLSYFPKSNYRFITPSSYCSESMAACAADGGYPYDITVLADGTYADLPYIADFTKGGSPSSDNGNTSYYTAQAVPDADCKTAVSLWDFTKSYDSDGFSVPAGKSGILSVPDTSLAKYLGVPVSRCIKTTFKKGSDILIASPASPLNLAELSSVSFLISCTAESPFSFDIIFISGTDRAIFTAAFDGTGIYTPVCDLSETDVAKKVDRIAIVLKEGDNVELAISEVTASGNIESGEDTLFITETQAPDPVADEAATSDNPDRVFYIFCIALGTLTAITILVFVTISIKEQ